MPVLNYCRMELLYSWHTWFIGEGLWVLMILCNWLYRLMVLC
jgi:hypothetical protein